MYDFLKYTQQKSIRDRVCQLCGETIHKGQEYIYVRGAEDGALFYTQLHIHCHAMLEADMLERGKRQYSKTSVKRSCAAACVKCQGVCGGEDVFTCEKVISAVIADVNTRRAALESARIQDRYTEQDAVQESFDDGEEILAR